MGPLSSSPLMFAVHATSQHVSGTSSPSFYAIRSVCFCDYRGIIISTMSDQLLASRVSENDFIQGFTKALQRDYSSVSQTQVKDALRAAFPVYHNIYLKFARLT
jgi:hypothetical protein